MGTYCIAQGTLLNVIWQPGWEGNLGENQFSSVTQLCLTLCDPMDCSIPGFLVFHQFPELAQTHVHRVGDAIQSSHPVIPFSSCLQSFSASGSFPVSQFFRWLKYWSFSFSISPSNEHSGLISFGMDWFDLHAVQGTLKSLHQHHSSCICMAESLFCAPETITTLLISPILRYDI